MLIDKLQQQKYWHKWLESLIIMAAVMAAGFYFHPNDPFFINHTFPLIWFAPVILTLMYGLEIGITASVILCIGLVIYVDYFSIPLYVYRNYLFVFILLMFIISQYKNSWANQIAEAKAKAQYLEEKMELLSENYFLLRQSHNLLEFSLITKPATLRSSLVQIRNISRLYQGDFNTEVAEQLLALLTGFCNIEKGIFYQYEPITDHFSQLTNLADLEPFDRADPSAIKAIKLKTTAYIGIDDPNNIHSKYLFVVPLITIEHNLLGLLVVKQMPFLHLNAENLEVITILLMYYANSLAAISQMQKLLKAFKNCDLDFARELYQLRYLSEKHKFQSYLVAFKFSNHSAVEDILRMILTHQRAIDVSWNLKINDHVVLLYLLPFSRVETVDGFIARIQRLVEEKFLLSAEEVLLAYFSKIDGTDPLIQLQAMCDRIRG